MADVLLIVVLALGFAGLGFGLGRGEARRRMRIRAVAGARVQAAIRESAILAAATMLKDVELSAREDGGAESAGGWDVIHLREADLAAWEVRIGVRREAVENLALEVQKRREQARAVSDPAPGAEGEIRVETERQRVTALERRAGQDAVSLRMEIAAGEVEEMRIAAAHLVRSVDSSGGDPESDRRADRLMGIAAGRLSGHYLTERLLSNVRVPAGISVDLLAGKDETNLRAVESVANVKLSIVEGRDAIRLEGLDGVGREVARRVLAWIGRQGGTPIDAGRVTRTTRDLAGGLDREIRDLGIRAFDALQIPRAHPEIVTLVGRLNYRTSFTQNQWKHALEAAFLCGMMADEMGLDVKVARRAALMHDIGKALTHELDGSHAVIGADYARRLGESEIVANAIGAHHTDEPFSSPLAYLVAAADAMSGARPGARRQMEDNFGTRIDDLERISRGFPGVEEAFAVQGGREVRIYVGEDQVDDRRAVDLSSEIARKISEEMTFPGQIRVTVIRETRAVEVAN